MSSPRSRLAGIITLALLSLTACSNDGRTDATSDPSTGPSPSAAPPGVSPSAEASPDPRSPEALATQFTFESPPGLNPAIQEGLDGYADFVRQFVVAQGLGDATYPPLLARIDRNEPGLEDFLLSSLQGNQAAGEYLLGALTDRVTEAAGNVTNVYIDTCTDCSDHSIFSQSTGNFIQDPGFEKVRAQAVMTRGATGWVISQYNVPKEQNCA